MKTRLTGATFDASAKTITHASFSDVTLAGIQLITNVTDQIIIYNFADTAKGGTLSTDTLTLEYDTTSMSDTDELMILVEDGSASTAINDGGNTITVDGTVSVTGVSTAANQTTIIGHLDGVEGILTTIDADTGVLAGTVVAGQIQVDIAAASTDITVQDGGGSLTVDNNGTFAVQASLNAGTNNIGDVDVVSSALPTGASTLAEQQSQTTHLSTISGDTTSIQTAVELLDDTVATDGSATPTKGILMAGQDGTNAQTIKTDTNGELQVDVLTMPTVAVTQSGTWDEVGINDSGNSITVDYATTGSGTATGALRVELPTNGTGVIATVGAVTAITNALPAGTNAIGKLSANSGVDIGDVTLTAGTAAVGSILPPDTDVTAHTNYARKYYTNAGAVTDGIIWSPAAGKRWHVVTMYIQTSAAATITLEDDKAGGDDPVWKGEIAANSGVTLSFTEHYPMASGEDAADLIITTSAGNVYVTCVGYEV